jgi:hypothetical protein
VELTPQSRDTMRVTITVDSITVSSNLEAPAPDVRHLQGAKVTGTVSPQGRIYLFEPPAGSADAETSALYGAFRRFLLPFPRTPLRVGAKWVDTSASVTKRGGLDITTREVSTSTVVGDAGERAWKVERQSTVATDGQGREAGEPIHLIGDGTISGVHLVSPRGTYLHAESTQKLNLTLSMSASGAGGDSKPIAQTIVSTVERLQ